MKNLLSASGSMRFSAFKIGSSGLFTQLLFLAVLGFATTSAYGMQEEVRTYACSVCKQYPEKIHRIVWSLSAGAVHPDDKTNTFSKIDVLDDLFCCDNDISKMEGPADALEAEFKKACHKARPGFIWDAEITRSNDVFFIDNPIIEKIEKSIAVPLFTNKYMWGALVLACIAAKLYNTRRFKSANEHANKTHTGDDEQVINT